MEILLEAALQILLFLAEFVFTVVGEGLFDWGRNKKVEKKRHAKPEAVSPTAGPLLTGLAYAAFGALCGVVSLWIAPSSFIESPALRWLNLLASPLLAGLLTAQWRAFKAKPGEPQNYTADFIDGALLALALAATRLVLAR